MKNLYAAIKTGLMVAREMAPKKRQRITCRAEAVGVAAAEMALRDREEFRALLLGARHELLEVATIAQGTRDACLVHARDLFRAALVAGACAIILIHNHPSGDPGPSDEDRALTRRVVACGRLLGIPVLDHIVVGTDGSRSIRDDEPEVFGA